MAKSPSAGRIMRMAANKSWWPSQRKSFCAAFFSMCFPMASSASVSSAFWPTAGASPCYRSANSCCECLLPVVRILLGLKLVLQRYGIAHVVVARCSFYSASPLRNSNRHRWNGGFTLTALNRFRGAVRPTNVPACTLYVCSDCAFHSNSAISTHVFAAETVHPILKTLSTLIGFIHSSGPVLHPKIRNRIQIP